MIPYRNITHHPLTVMAIPLVTAVFYLLTLTEGHEWGGDFSQYIVHAINLAEGRPYFYSSYIVNQYAFNGPISYPPVFPILLAPIYLIFGINFTALKCLVIGCFCISLIFIRNSFRENLNNASLNTILLLIVFNPVIWGFRENIISDFTFVLFCFSSLYLMQKNSDQFPTRSSDKKIGHYVLLGISMYLAYGTREIGLVLPMTLITFQLWRFKKVTLGALLAVSIFSLLAYIQNQYIAGDPTSPELRKGLARLVEEQYSYSGHLSFINFDPKLMMDSALAYLHTISDLFPRDNIPALKFLSFPIIILLTALAGIGFICQLFTKITALEIFCGGYLVALLLFRGFGGIRYLLPLIPFYFYYVFILLNTISSRFQLNLTSSKLYYIGLLAIIILYSNALFQRSFTHAITKPTDEYATNMFQFLKQYNPEGKTIVFDKPRVLGLFTELNTAAYPPGREDKFILQYLETLNAELLVSELINFNRQQLLSKPSEKQKMIERQSKFFTEVYRNKYFVVYSFSKITPASVDQEQLDLSITMR